MNHPSNGNLLADKLVKQLAARGLKPFADHRSTTGIIPGEDWLKALGHRLKSEQAVLVLLSDAWRDSQLCQAALNVWVRTLVI